MLSERSEYGILITDKTQDDKLRKLMRKMRAFNLVPSKLGTPARSLLVNRILDDPIARDSRHSYFVQMADIIAYALARRDYPKASLSSWQFETYFDILNPVLLTQASSTDQQGIVYWPK